MVETLAQSRPLLVVFEDLHWAEPTFLDLVESLAVQRLIAVLVCIARPELLEQRPVWAARAARAVSIDCTPLADGPAAALLDALADSSASHRLPGHGSQTAAGNLLYLEQLAVSLSEQAGSQIRPVLPPTIQALLAARLQRLGPGASSALARAAVVGKDFGVDAVRELLPPEARGPLSRNLQTLVARGLVQQGPPDRSRAEHISPHILIQEAAYLGDPQVASRRAAPPLRRLARVRCREPATQGADTRLSPRTICPLPQRTTAAEAQSSPLPRRAATHTPRRPAALRS